MSNDFDLLLKCGNEHCDNIITLDELKKKQIENAMVVARKCALEKNLENLKKCSLKHSNKEIMKKAMERGKCVEKNCSVLVKKTMNSFRKNPKKFLKKAAPKLVSKNTKKLKTNIKKIVLQKMKNASKKGKKGKKGKKKTNKKTK